VSLFFVASGRQQILKRQINNKLKINLFAGYALNLFGIFVRAVKPYTIRITVTKKGGMFYLTNISEGLFPIE
jgi:hypothetical protein